MTEVIPEPPVGLDERGSHLWVSLHEAQVFSPVERELVLEACRVADRLERLEDICSSVDPVVETDKGGLITHPAFAESRQQQNLLKQLIAALRLPDEASGKRPQQRGGARGAYKPSGKLASVSSLERARTKSNSA